MTSTFDTSKVSSSASSSFISGQESPQQTTGSMRTNSPGYTLNNVNPNANYKKPGKHVDPNQFYNSSGNNGPDWIEEVLQNLCCETCRNLVEDPVAQVAFSDTLLVCRKCARGKKNEVVELPIGVVSAIRQVLEKGGVATDSSVAKEDISSLEEDTSGQGRRVAGVARHAGRAPVDGSVASPAARDFDEDTSSVVIAERNERNEIINQETDGFDRLIKQFRSKKVASKTGGTTSRDAKVEADKHYENGDYTAALELYTKAIALQKVDKIAHAKFLYGNRSAAYFMAGRFKECTEDCLVVFQMEPTNYKLLLRAALSAVSMGDLAKAVSILEIVPAKERDAEPKLAERYAEYKSALELYRKGEKAFGTPEGDDHYRMLVSQFPSTVPFRERFAESLLRRKQYLRAVETLEVISQKARTPKVLHLMAMCLSLSGFEYFEKAKKCLAEPAQYDDDCRKLLNEINNIDDFKQKGNHNFSSKKFKEAVEQYTQAIKLATNNDAILRILYCNRAAAYKEIGNYREGVEDCTKAIEIAPEFFKAYARRARCHMNLGDNFAAVRDFKKALSLERNDRELEKELRQAENALSKEAEKEKDYYFQLGLTKTCSDRDIKVKYRELSLRWHPDKCVNLDETEKERAEHKFKIISEAYAVLSDPAKRREYDWAQDRERLTRPAGFGFSGGFGTAAVIITEETDTVPELV